HSSSRVRLTLIQHANNQLCRWIRFPQRRPSYYHMYGTLSMLNSSSQYQSQRRRRSEDPRRFQSCSTRLLQGRHMVSSLCAQRRGGRRHLPLDCKLPRIGLPILLLLARSRLPRRVRDRWHHRYGRQLSQRDGVFTSTRFQYQEGGPTSFPTANFPLNALTSVLAPAETAVAYSPRTIIFLSGFSANLAHGCYSYFPVIELAGRTGCLCRLTNATHETATRTFDCFGETTTQTEDVLAAVTSETIGREPFTFTADEWEFAMEGDRNPYPTDEPLQGMALAPFILMVNGGGDGGAER
ncbi:hypothetical protein BN1708_005371, partial [Verticillium longisporum]